MKLALISDLHSQKICLKYLEKIIKQEDVKAVVSCGDNTVEDDTDFIKKVFSIIKESKKEGFFIWGNSDRENVQEIIKQSDFNIHLQEKTIDSFKIFGLSYLEEYPAFNSSKITGSIFITHQPPIQKALNQKCANAPYMHISGHLHKKAFAKKHPSTTHIQVPTLIDGRYGLLDLNTKLVEFKVV